MNQSSIIAAALIVAFIVFITVRGELPCWLAVFGISSGANCTLGASVLQAAGMSAGAANAAAGAISSTLANGV